MITQQLTSLVQQVFNLNVILTIGVLVVITLVFIFHFPRRQYGKGALTKAGRYLKDYHGGGEPEDVVDACEELAAAYDFVEKKDRDGEFEGADAITDVIKWVWADRDEFIEEVIKAASQAWPGEFPGYSQSPIELIVKIIDERDDDRKSIAGIQEKLKQAWPSSWEPYHNDQLFILLQRLVKDALRYRRLREGWVVCQEMAIAGRTSVVDAGIDRLLKDQGA